MPLGSNLVTPGGVDSLHRLTMGKLSNINISKASWQILFKLHTQCHWAVKKVAYCFWADQTGTLVAMAGNIQILMEKEIKNLLL